MGKDRHLVLAESGHFWCVHFVSVDEVSEESSIRVGKIVRLMENEIWIISQDCVEGVVLKMGGVEMLTCELVTSVLSDQSFEVFHGEEVRIIPARSFKSYVEAGVEHLVISLIEKGWSQKGFIAIGNFRYSKSRN